MITNIYDFKTNLSYYLNLVQKGKKIVIAKRNIPIAEINPIGKITPKRIIGQSEGEFEVPEEFFEPLPKDIIEAFSNPK